MKIRLLVAAMCVPVFSTYAATFTVTNTAASGPGSLNQAIFNANNSNGLDIIAFDIPPNDGSVKTIMQTNTLTPITEAVILDGYTQPGASSNTLAIGNNAVLLIEVTTTNGSQGLGSQSSNVIIRGLVINGFGQGVSLGINGSGSAVEGCWIGTDATGTNASARAVDTGITCQNGNMRIGGTNPWQRNVIAGCLSGGIETVNGFSTNILITGNYIGTDKTGTKAITNGIGIDIEAPAAQIISNVISGNSGEGIKILQTNTLVQANIIGAAVNGTNALGNSFGISICGGCGSNQIGTANVISGNRNTGILVGGDDSLVTGNHVGTDPTGNVAVPNNNGGINLSGPSPGGNHITGNLIANNNGYGLSFVTATNNLAENNTIENNTSNGVVISGTDNTIADNIIAFNGEAGISVPSNTGFTNNTFSSNSIFSNGLLGIDLIALSESAGTPTTNDVCDTDTGPNKLQNFPVLLSSTSGVSSVTIAGFLPSAPSTNFTLEFFANTVCDPSGFGEGETFIGTTNVTTGANCTNNFTVTFPVAVANALLVTATATDPSGNTSEFSACLTNVSTVVTNVAPQITCPANVNTNTAAGTCARSVPFVAAATGTPTPTISYKTNGVTVTSPVTFPKGVTTVSATASNVAGTDQCAFTVTVTDNLLPSITCHSDITSNVAVGVTNTVVHFGAPTSSDNCPGVTTNCAPSSGSTFALGTNTVTCTAIDSAGNTNTCTFKVIVQQTPPCVITCPSDIVSNTAPGLCGATVTFNVSSSGSCPSITAIPASGTFFNKGTNTVTVTTNGVTACTFNVTVNDNVAPSITCHATITSNVAAGVTNTGVTFGAPTVSDNCGVASTNCTPTSGSTFGLGTNTVTCTAVDTSGNTNTCTFHVIVQQTSVEVHDLSILSIKPPKHINLKAATPALTKRVKVQIQNLSDHSETISNLTVLANLVSVTLSNLQTSCTPPTADLIQGPPNVVPKTIKPNGKLNVFFNVMFSTNCLPDAMKGVGHEDFSYTAHVDHSALDGNADTNPSNDDCPRGPSGSDKGCGGKNPDKTLGAAVKTDVFLKQ